MHRAGLARAAALLVTLSFVACGSPSSAPEPETRAEVVEPEPEPVPATAETPPEAARPDEPAPADGLPVADAPIAQQALAPVALGDGGLPPVTSGRPIRLQSTLATTTREVDGHRLASVTLADVSATANLDAWFERQSYCRGRVQLAIDGFVSYVCSYFEPAAGGGSSYLGMNVTISEAGVVTEVGAQDIFLPGTDIRAMIGVWADDPSAVRGEVAFGPNGAIVVPMSDSQERLHLPWRTIAPYVRADGPLGRALAAEGLTLAPVGTSAPPTPQQALALTFSGAGRAMAAAARLPAATRAATRLRVSADEAVLLLAPGGGDSSAFDRATADRHERRYFYGPMAQLVSVSIGATLDVHESAGPRTPVVWTLPTGTVTVAAVGPVGSRASALGSSWVLVAARSVGGYAQGRHVTALDGCETPANEVNSLGGYAEPNAGTRLAWTAAPLDDGRVAVTVFPVGEGCAIGEQLRRVAVDGIVTDLRFAPTTAEGGGWLLVVVSSMGLSETTRTVSVFDASGAPAFQRAFEAPTLRLGERRGPDRAAGFFPLSIASGDARTWLTWTGTAIEASTSP